MIPQATINEFKERIKGGEEITSEEDLLLLSQMIEQIHIKNKEVVLQGKGKKKKTGKPTAERKAAAEALITDLTKSIALARIAKGGKKE